MSVYTVFVNIMRKGILKSFCVILALVVDSSRTARAAISLTLMMLTEYVDENVSTRVVRRLPGDD